MCANLNTDAANCGACGNACGAGMNCSSGACVCDAPGTNCTNTCVHLDTDAANCGTCGNACGAGMNCSSGACVCDAPDTNCAGACVNLNTDAANCGACGNACDPGKVCRGGACVGDGPLRFTLTWDLDWDVDLCVVPPGCAPICYYDKIQCFGELDMDSLGSDGRHTENIFWQNGSMPLSGEYLICVRAFQEEALNATYSLEVVNHGAVVLTASGTRFPYGVYGNDPACDASFPGVYNVTV
jgi:hypothetical protein